jgi:hypothetical protein
VVGLRHKDLSRLAGHDQAQVNVAVHTDINLDLVFERLIKQFDHEPDIKSRIAQALLNVDHEQAEVACRRDHAAWSWSPQKTLAASAKQGLGEPFRLSPEYAPKWPGKFRFV